MYNKTSGQKAYKAAIMRFFVQFTIKFCWTSLMMSSVNNVQQPENIEKYRAGLQSAPYKFSRFSDYCNLLV